MDNFRKFILVALFLFCSPGFLFAQESLAPQVRVAILQDKEDFNLSIHGPFVLKNAETGVVLEKLPFIYDANVHLVPQGIALGSQKYNNKNLMFEPSRSATVYVNRHPFRGKISILRTWDDRLMVINTIDVEQYVKGVLYHEISHHWPLEAIKAQAVAARTYALYSKEFSFKRDFDVTSDIYSQVYGGKNAERFRTSLGVDATAGIVLAYKGKLLPAYFHASCGGKTEDAANLWDVSLPPLKGIVCIYCADSPHFKWKGNFRLKDIQEALDQKGHHVEGLIKDIVVLTRNKSGRVEKLKITTREGNEIVISGKDFRDAVGPNEIKSSNFEIVMKGYFMDLVGFGWGHGVGLCQWGAFGMARIGKDYKDILQFYYPGAELVDFSRLKK